MDKIEILLLAMAAGGLLGSMFFSGLWWTVKKGLSSKQPARLYLGSLLLRSVLAVYGFYFVSDGHWQRLLPCLFGFIVVRYLFGRHFGMPTEDRNLQTNEASHAA